LKQLRAFSYPEHRRVLRQFEFIVKPVGGGTPSAWTHQPENDKTIYTSHHHN